MSLEGEVVLVTVVLTAYAHASLVTVSVSEQTVETIIS
jgi:hypothetical protein